MPQETTVELTASEIKFLERALFHYQDTYLTGDMISNWQELRKLKSKLGIR